MKPLAQSALVLCVFTCATVAKIACAQDHTAAALGSAAPVRGVGAQPRIPLIVSPSTGLHPHAGRFFLAPQIGSEPTTPLGIPYSVERAMMIDAIGPPNTLRLQRDRLEIRSAPEIKIPLQESSPMQLRDDAGSLDLRLKHENAFPLIQD